MTEEQFERMMKSLEEISDGIREVNDNLSSINSNINIPVTMNDIDDVCKAIEALRKEISRR